MQTFSSIDRVLSIALDEGHPAALLQSGGHVCKLMNDGLLFITHRRDAHQSLLATRMRTADMLPPAQATAHILRNAGAQKRGFHFFVLLWYTVASAVGKKYG